MADSGFQRGASSTLSLRDKHTLKRKINKEHNSNFRAGYVHIQEEYLHRTGIRGRKTHCVYAITCILFLATLVNLLLTLTMIGVLKINKDGMRSIEFDSTEDLLRFLEDSHMGDTVTALSNRVMSLPEESMNFTGDGAPVAMMVRAKNNSTATSVSVNEDKVSFNMQESFRVQDADSGKTIFSSNISEFKFPYEMQSLDVKRVFTNRVVSGLGDNLKLESASNVTVRSKEDLEVDTNQVLLAAHNDLVFTSWSGLHIEGEKGPFLQKVMKIAYTGGSDPIDPSQESLKICVCVPSGRTFAVPAPYTCAEANEDQNPCLL